MVKCFDCGKEIEADGHEMILAGIQGKYYICDTCKEYRMKTRVKRYADAKKRNLHCKNCGILLVDKATHNFKGELCDWCATKGSNPMATNPRIVYCRDCGAPINLDTYTERNATNHRWNFDFVELTDGDKPTEEYLCDLCFRRVKHKFDVAKRRAIEKDKRCKKCGKLLIPQVSWGKREQNRNQLICKECRKAELRAKRRKKK